MTSYSNLSRTNKTSARALLRTASWMDMWLFSVRSIVTANSTKKTKYHWLFLTGAQTLMMVTKTDSVLWTNSALKRLDAVLGKISNIITREYKMEVLSAPIILETEERLIWDEEIRKAISF